MQLSMVAQIEGSEPMFYDNYLRLCNSVGKSPTAVALEIGLKASTVTRWKKGTIPTDATLIKIADYFDISVDYLLGNVPKEKPATISDDEHCKGKLPSNIFPVPKMRRVPIVGTIRAGMPILAEENIEGYEYDDVPEDSDYFFLRVKGDSMIGAHILDGSLALIKPQQCAEDGQIVACLVNGDEATLKRFYQQKDMVILKPENPAYSPIVVPCSDFDSGYARILGVVTEVKFKV